jgi:ribose 5-phosphate isomerase
LAEALNGIPGVVEHGIFLGLATEAMIASATEVVRLAAAK